MSFTGNVARIDKSKNCWTQKEQSVKNTTAKVMDLKNKVNATPNKLELEELSLAIPGLKNVLDSRKGFVFNVLWFLVIGCSGLICFYQIYNRFQIFISNPIDSQITLKQNESVKFPSLTMCAPEERCISLIPLQQQKSAKQNISLCDVKFADLMPELNISTIWSLMNTHGLINSSTIITRLKLKNHAFLNTLQTNSRLTYFGNCTTFSINNLIPFRGEDYKVNIPLTPLWNYNCGTQYYSAMYLFHHDDEDITYRIIAENSYLPVLTVMNWGIEAKRFTVINRSYEPCDKISVVSQCERQCVENILKTRFTCRLPFMDFDGIPLCTNSTQAHQVYKETYNIVLGIVYTKNCSCPDRCEKILYSSNLALTSIFHYSMLEYFFESNVIMDIQEYYSYTLIPFICDVGGNLGLFLGLCIPAIIDILQNVIVYLVTKIITARDV